jgi:universal stress protein A
MAYSKILVAIDLTDEADEVIAQAIESAEQNNAELSLITVVKPITQVYGGFDVGAMGADVVQIEREAIDQAETALKAHAQRAGVPDERAMVGRGSPAHEIREVAEQQGADLIIMGTHGRHGLGLLLGSTATGVLHGAPCDVLTVRIS